MVHTKIKTNCSHDKHAYYAYFKTLVNMPVSMWGILGSKETFYPPKTQPRWGVPSLHKSINIKSGLLADHVNVSINLYLQMCLYFNCFALF